MPPLKTEIMRDTSRTIIARNKSPDISFDQSINPYRGLRAWLHLLLRAADPRLSRPVAGRGFRNPHLRQAQCAGLAGARNCPRRAMCPKSSPWAPTPIPISRIEKQDAHHALHPGSAARLQASRRHRHQIGADPARPRYSGADGGRWVWRRRRSRSPRWTASWRATWSRAPARRRGGSQAIRGLGRGGVPAGVMFAPVIPALNDDEMEAVLAAADRSGRASARAMCCCACRWRSRICSANGWRRTCPAAPSM